MLADLSIHNNSFISPKSTHVAMRGDTRSGKNLSCSPGTFPAEV